MGTERSLNWIPKNCLHLPLRLSPLTPGNGVCCSGMIRTPDKAWGDREQALGARPSQPAWRIGGQRWKVEGRHSGTVEHKQAGNREIMCFDSPTFFSTLCWYRLGPGNRNRRVFLTSGDSWTSKWHGTLRPRSHGISRGLLMPSSLMTTFLVCNEVLY